MADTDWGAIYEAEYKRNLANAMKSRRDYQAQTTAYHDSDPDSPSLWSLVLVWVLRLASLWMFWVRFKAMFEQEYATRMSHKDGAIQAARLYTRKQCAWELLVEFIFWLILLPFRLIIFLLELLWAYLRWVFGTLLDPFVWAFDYITERIQFVWMIWANSRLHVHFWNFHQRVLSIEFIYKVTILGIFGIAFFKLGRALITSPEVYLLPRSHDRVLIPTTSYTDFDPRDTATRSRNPDVSSKKTDSTSGSILSTSSIRTDSKNADLDEFTTTIFETTSCDDLNSRWRTRCHLSKIVDTIIKSTTTTPTIATDSSELPRPKVLGDDQPVITTLEDEDYKEWFRSSEAVSDPKHSPVTSPSNYRTTSSDDDRTAQEYTTFDSSAYEKARESHQLSYFEQAAKSRESNREVARELRTSRRSAVSEWLKGHTTGTWTDYGPTPPAIDASDVKITSYWSKWDDAWRRLRYQQSTSTKPSSKAQLTEEVVSSTTSNSRSPPPVSRQKDQTSTSTTTPSKEKLSWEVVEETTSRWSSPPPPRPGWIQPSKISDASKITSRRPKSHADSHPRTEKSTSIKSSRGFGWPWDSLTRTSRSETSPETSPTTSAKAREKDLESVADGTSWATDSKQNADGIWKRLYNGPADKISSLKSRAAEEYSSATSRVGVATSLVKGKAKAAASRASDLAQAAYSDSASQVSLLKEKADEAVNLAIDSTLASKDQSAHAVRDKANKVVEAAHDAAVRASSLGRKAGDAFSDSAESLRYLEFRATEAIVLAMDSARWDTTQQGSQLVRKAKDALQDFLVAAYADTNEPLDSLHTDTSSWPTTIEEISENSWSNWWRSKQESATARLSSHDYILTPVPSGTVESTTTTSGFTDTATTMEKGRFKQFTDKLLGKTYQISTDWIPENRFEAPLTFHEDQILDTADLGPYHSSSSVPELGDVVGSKISDLAGSLTSDSRAEESITTSTIVDDWGRITSVAEQDTVTSGATIVNPDTETSVAEDDEFASDSENKEDSTHVEDKEEDECSSVSEDEEEHPDPDSGDKTKWQSESVDVEESTPEHPDDKQSTTSEADESTTPHPKLEKESTPLTLIETIEQAERARKENAAKAVRARFEFETGNLPLNVVEAMQQVAGDEDLEWEFEITGRKPGLTSGDFEEQTRPESKTWSRFGGRFDTSVVSKGSTGEGANDGTKSRSKTRGKGNGSRGSESEDWKFCESCRQEHCCVTDEDGVEHRSFG